MTTTDAFFMSWSRSTLPVALREAAPAVSAAPAPAPTPARPFLARHPRLLDALRALMRRPSTHPR